MFVFVDESGDAGLKLTQGSSAYFVIALVIVEDEDDADAIRQRLRLLKRELHLNPELEFKFNKCRPDIRRGFLQAVAPYYFFYYGIVINKAELYGEGFKFKGPFYKYATQLVFLNAREHLEDARVLIDASGDREFRRQFTTYLKKKVNAEKRHIRKLGFADSKNEALIQLADMVAGAIARSFSDKGDRDDYIRLIRHREAGIQVWPQLKKR